MTTKRLPKRHAGSPLHTNASLNRSAATECFKAGMTVEAIAAEWPEVFKVSVEGGVPKLGQRYDYELADGSGRYETRYTITRESVTCAIAQFNAHRKGTTDGSDR